MRMYKVTPLVPGTIATLKYDWWPRENDYCIDAGCMLLIVASGFESKKWECSTFVICQGGCFLTAVELPTDYIEVINE